MNLIGYKKNYIISAPKFQDFKVFDMDTNSLYSILIKYEGDLAKNLLEVFEGPEKGKTYYKYHKIWQTEVQRVAQNLGKIDINQEEIKKGFALVEKPIFVCGPPRSGTTMIRDIFDDHPQICALPGEARLFTNLMPQLKKLEPDKKIPFLIDIWLRNSLIKCVEDPFLVFGKSD